MNVHMIVYIRAPDRQYTCKLLTASVQVSGLESSSPVWAPGSRRPSSARVSLCREGEAVGNAQEEEEMEVSLLILFEKRIQLNTVWQ